MKDEAKKKKGETLNGLRRQLATLEAKAEIVRVKINRMDAKEAGAPCITTGLDLLWEAALPNSRIRSSKLQCRTEWNRIPVSERPAVAEVLAALKIWNRTSQWKAESGLYAPGLHRFIKNRMWESLPDLPKPMARYTPVPEKPAPPQEKVSMEEVREILGKIKRVRS
jgi:hypothetical protein